MPIAKIDKQQAIGALKATGSSDPDILYARKEELLSETKKMKLLGTAPIVVGVLMSLTIIGAVVGIPAMIFGFSMRSRMRRNVAAVDEAYTEYVSATGTQARATSV